MREKRWMWVQEGKMTEDQSGASTIDWAVRHRWRPRLNSIAEAAQVLDHDRVQGRSQETGNTQNAVKHCHSGVNYENMAFCFQTIFHPLNANNKDGAFKIVFKSWILKLRRAAPVFSLRLFSCCFNSDAATWSTRGLLTITHRCLRHPVLSTALLWLQRPNSLFFFFFPISTDPVIKNDSGKQQMGRRWEKYFIINEENINYSRTSFVVPREEKKNNFFLWSSERKVRIQS